MISAIAETPSTRGHRPDRRGVAVHGNILYIAEAFAGQVVSVPTSGGTPTPVATGLNGPRGLNVSGSILHITEMGAGRVVAVPTSGGTPTAVATGLSGPIGVMAR